VLNIARSASCWLHVGCVWLDHARKIRDRLFVHGRRLRLLRLPDLRQVAAGQEREEAGGHATSTRSVERSANRPTGGARNTRQPLPIGDVDEFAKRTGEDRAFQAGAPGTGALGPAGSRMRALACR
jgi:hypothetical protein